MHIQQLGAGAWGAQAVGQTFWSPFPSKELAQPEDLDRRQTVPCRLKSDKRPVERGAVPNFGTAVCPISSTQLKGPVHTRH